MNAPLVVVVAALVCCSACPPPEEEEEDKPNPLAGFYLVTTHTEASPCDAEPAVPTPAISAFSLEEDSFLGAPFLGFHDCSSTGTKDGCDDASSLEFSAFGEDDDVEVSSCSCLDGTCGIGGSIGGWHKTDTGVELNLEQRSGEVSDDSDPDCDAGALFAAHKNELQCQRIVVLVGDKG